METDNLPREAQTGPIFHPDWGTHAYSRYDANIVGLDALLAMVFPLLNETEKSKRYLKARIFKIENDFSGPWSVNLEHSMLSWQVAMRVSAVEVYLQDSLTFLAVYDPEFIRSRGSKQEWDYDLIRTSSDNNDAVWTFCNRWAKGFIGEGGPRRWAKSLQGSGLGRYEESSIISLEAMWGYRHMRIHNGGRLSREFIARHGEIAESLIQNGLQIEDIQKWSDTARSFVMSAEKSISGRLKAKLGENLIKDRQEKESERQMAWLDERYKNILNSETEEERTRRISRNEQAFKEKCELMDELFK